MITPYFIKIYKFTQTKPWLREKTTDSAAIEETTGRWLEIRSRQKRGRLTRQKVAISSNFPHDWSEGSRFSSQFRRRWSNRHNSEDFDSNGLEIASFCLDLLGSRSPLRDHSRPLRIAISPARFVTASSWLRSPLRDPLQRRCWRSRCRHNPGSCRRPIVVVISDR